MGWLVAFFLFIGGWITKDNLLFVAAGLFAIAGSISFHEK